jgi:hypothetical protein
MSYLSNLGGVPVINDSTFSQALQEAKQFGTGYIPRDFAATPVGTFQAYTGPRFDEDELVERIKEKEARKSGLADLHRKLDIPVLDQGQLGYCWMYGTVKCMMMAYALAGLPVPFLSATSAAAKGKNYANQGGLAEEALKYINRFGVSTVKFWPDGGVADRRYDTPEQRNNAALHKAVEFEELPSNDLLAVASALVLDLPCTGGFAWWGHLIALLQPRVVSQSRGERIGLEFVNSWTKRYGKNGFSVLAGRKAIPFEAYRIRTVTVARDGLQTAA